MKNYSPYTTAEFKSNLIVMPQPTEPAKLGMLKGLAWGLPVMIPFWAILFYGIKELVR